MTLNTKRPLSGNSVAKPKIRLGQTILRPADSIISYFGLGLYMEMKDMKHIEKAEVYYVRLTKEESIKFQNKLKEYNKTYDLRIWLE